MYKILVIRLGAIGDVLATTNLTQAIKKAYPNTEIHYLTTKTPSEILKYNSDISKVIVLNDKSYSNLLKLSKDFKKEKYDLIINLQPSTRTKFLSLLSAPKKVVTYKKTFKKHAVPNFFDTALKVLPEIKLNSELKLHIPQEIVDSVKDKLPQFNKLVVLNPSCSKTRQGRKWRPQYFKELALSLINRYDCLVVFSGSREDLSETMQFEGLHENIINCAGRFSLIESCALYSLSNIVISSDTGPLHLATATEKPVCIGLYGAAPISRTGPWGLKHFALTANLPCSPCNRRKCKYKSGEFNPCLDALKADVITNLISEEELL